MGTNYQIYFPQFLFAIRATTICFVGKFCKFMLPIFTYGNRLFLTKRTFFKQLI